MDELDELEGLEQETELDWQCASPGLRHGVDNELDALITLHAPRVLRGLAADEPRGRAPDTWPASDGLREVQLRLSVNGPASLQVLSRLAATPHGWQLPNLQWDENVSIAVRIRVPVGMLPSVNSLVSLARVTVVATAVRDGGADQSTVMLRLRAGAAVLADAEWETFPLDEDLTRSIEYMTDRPATPVRASTAASLATKGAPS